MDDDKLDAAILGALTAHEGSEILLGILNDNRDREREKAVALRVNEVLREAPRAVDFWVLAAHAAAWCGKSPDPAAAMMAFQRTIAGMIEFRKREGETVN